jgi:hypothetical protein
MAVTPKVAVVALLVASLTAGCGASAEEKEAACWTTRQAIIAEISAVAIMDSWAQYSVYNERSQEFWGEDEGKLSRKVSDQIWNERTISHMLAAELPDC